MDVLLVRASPFVLPSQRRADAIVHEGAADMRLWPGPGPDSDLREAWGDGLQQTLTAERERLGVETVPLLRPVRVQPGRLHCDFLIWVATRPPERGTEREPAPDAEALERAVHGALEFAAERDVGRVAFPALGWGPRELPRVERLERIVRAAHAFGEARYGAGRPAGIDQVLVCEPQGEVMRELSRRVSAIVRGTVEAAPSDKPPSRRAAGRTRSTGGRRSARKPALDPDELARARLVAERYDMRCTYAAGDWLAHPKFGVGRVEQVTPEGAILVRFEDGEQRKMVHGR
ncbi:MAG: hypothetical protein ACODAU_03605 [Myxococcota bacterium]